MKRKYANSPLFWTTLLGLGLALACASGERSLDGGSGGWGDDSRSNAENDTDTDTDADTDTDTDADTDIAETGEAETGAPDSGLVDTAVEEDCDDATPVVLYMSPDDSNSMSSASQVRAAVLGEWAGLSYVSIRTWEFLNYYDFAYEPASEGELALDMQLAPMEEGNDEDWLLQIAVSAPDLANEDRAPMNLTFVLDTSGSMSGEPLAVAQQVVFAASSMLRQGDIVSLVTWNTENSILVENHEHEGLLDLTLYNAVADIHASGATDLYDGLSVGYELARNAYSPERINRVVLISDGGANVGITSEELIGEQASDNDGEGIYLVGVGVGSPLTYFDALMDQVTDAGKGASVFVDSTEEAWKMFSERFVNTMGVAGRDVQLELELPPGFEITKFSGEGYSHDPFEIDPQHIAPNDSMVFYNQIHTCASDLLEEDPVITVRVRYRDAMSFEQKETALGAYWSELLAGDTSLLHKGKAVYTYAESLKVAILESNHIIREEALSGALDAVEAAEVFEPEDEDLAEIRAVIEALKAQPAIGDTSASSPLGRTLRRHPVVSAWNERAMTEPERPARQPGKIVLP